MKTISIYNEKGNVSSTVRSQIKTQVMGRALSVLADAFGEGVVMNATGGISVPVAQDIGGETVYARFDMTITTQTPDHKPAKAKSKAEPKEPVVLVDLFEDEEA